MPHPNLKVIKAKRITTCNLPSCNQKFKLGDNIVSIGMNLWFHLGCGVIFTIDTALANDLVFLRTQVDKFARDKDMAALFHQRLATRDPIIYCGVPGSGKSTSLTAFVKLTGSSVNEVYVYNSSIAKYAAPPVLHPHPPLPVCLALAAAVDLALAAAVSPALAAAVGLALAAAVSLALAAAVRLALAATVNLALAAAVSLTFAAAVGLALAAAIGLAIAAVVGFALAAAVNLALAAAVNLVLAAAVNLVRI